jgi:V/A-type H+-transporting ATPase subunit I
MLGTPAQDEADPSVVVAVVAPILFGFMFGDVGQGFVVLLAGILLGRQLPLLRMLIPGGLSAMLFGLAFGSVFSREDIIPPLWLHPIEHPITLLVVAITIGVAVLSVGLGLDALQAHWRGEARQWWKHRAGLMLAYFGLVVTPIRIEGLAVAALGAVWYVLGAAAMVSGHRLGAIGRALAELVEEGLRLLVNTVSFARVGAFALAHAGLSVAIVEVANATGPYGYWPVLIAGNVLVIALEGLVVSIQTTRLMLFEFFIRFLIARGRAFSPLLPPDLPQMRYAEPKPEGTP